MENWSDAICAGTRVEELWILVKIPGIDLHFVKIPLGKLPNSLELVREIYFMNFKGIWILGIGDGNFPFQKKALKELEAGGQFKEHYFFEPIMYIALGDYIIVQRNLLCYYL